MLIYKQSDLSSRNKIEATKVITLLDSHNLKKLMFSFVFFNSLQTIPVANN